MQWGESKQMECEGMKETPKESLNGWMQWQGEVFTQEWTMQVVEVFDWIRVGR